MIVSNRNLRTEIQGSTCIILPEIQHRTIKMIIIRLYYGKLYHIRSAMPLCLLPNIDQESLSE